MVDSIWLHMRNTGPISSVPSDTSWLKKCKPHCFLESRKFSDATDLDWVHPNISENVVHCALEEALFIPPHEQRMRRKHLFEEFDQCYDAYLFESMSDTTNTSPDDRTRSKDAEHDAPVALTVSPTVSTKDLSNEPNKNDEVELIEEEDVGYPDSSRDEGDFDEEEFSVMDKTTLCWSCSCCVEEGADVR